MSDGGPAPVVASPRPPSPSGADAGDASPADPPVRPSRRDLLLLVVLVAVVAIPLVVAVIVLHHPRWYPMSDDAQTELRVRDVGGRNPPLTGLGGRIGPFGEDTGSHPGPLSFWSLAVFYRLLGAGSWALHTGVAALNVVAMGLTLWVARRRGGPALMVALAAALVVLVTAYSTYALTLPWNPYLPMLWWVLAVVAVWSVLCGDLPVLPVAVFALSFCIQTHISYLGLGGGLVAVGGLATAAWVVLRRRDRAELRSSLRWVAAGATLGAVLWFPPVAEQITGSQGHNMTIIYGHFDSPSEETFGLGPGIELLLATLDPWALLTQDVITDRLFLGGSTTPGLILLGAWAGAVAVAGWLRHSTLLRLHAVLALVLVCGAVSISRIFGPAWSYLALWGWSTGALLLVATGWSAVAGVSRLLADRTAGGPDAGERPDAERIALGARWRPVVAGVAAVVLVGLTVRATVDAAHTELFQPHLSATATALVPETIRALEEGSAPRTGRNGRYTLTWTDPWYAGARGFSMVNELDRAGFDVGAPTPFRYAVTRHRVIDPADATAQLHIAVGQLDIARWTEVPGAHRIAFHDPAGVEGRTEADQLRVLVADELEANGAVDMISSLDENAFALQFSDDLSAAGRARVSRIIELGQPLATFVAPPDATL